MKYAVIKRRKLGLEIYQVVIQDGEDVKHSVFLSEGGAHNWLRKNLRAISHNQL